MRLGTWLSVCIFAGAMVTACGGVDRGARLIPSAEVVHSTVITGNASVLLTWQDPTTGCDHVEVTYTPGGEAPINVAKNIGMLSVDGLENGVEYAFTIKTVNAAGVSSIGWLLTATPDGTKPAEVKGLKAQGIGNMATLNWSDPAAANLHHIKISYQSDTAPVTLSVAKGVGDYVVMYLTPGTIYTFKVQTVSLTGVESTGAVVTIQSPINLTYGTNPAVYTKSVMIEANQPASGGGAIDEYSVTPSLPAGLTLDGTTGAITGTPTAITSVAQYTVTASNTGGSTVAVLDITVNDVPPSGLDYPGWQPAMTVGAPITGVTPTHGGGTVLSYSVAPALPSGILLNAATGAITGTPLAATPPANYTVTARNSGGFDHAVLSIEVRRCWSFTTPFGFGDGTAENPYLVCSRTHLGNIAAHLAGNFLQVVDIDLSDSPFTPLGADNAGLTGIYDGGGFTITGLNYDSPTDTQAVALFRAVATGGVVKNLTLNAVNLVGNNVVAGVVGFNRGAISDVNMNGSLTGKATVGGIVGQNDGPGSMERVHVTGGTVYSSGTGNRIYGQGGANADCAAAGIVGVMYGGTLADCSSAANVTWDPAGIQIYAWTYAGGAVGYAASANITNCSATGDVVGGVDTGGFIGSLAGGTSTDNHATGDVHGTATVGGFSGYVSGIVSRCSAHGAVTATGEESGGFTGFCNCDLIQQSYSSGNVTGTAYIGGFTGTLDWSNVTMADCYSTGSVAATGGRSGGFIGWSGSYVYPTAMRTYSAAPSVGGNASVRGYIGEAWYATISNSYYYVNPNVAPEPNTHVVGLDQIAMTTQASFAGFDFTTVWAMPTANPLSPNLLAPVLRWQCGRDGVVCP